MLKFIYYGLIVIIVTSAQYFITHFIDKTYDDVKERLDFDQIQKEQPSNILLENEEIFTICENEYLPEKRDIIAQNYEIDNDSVDEEDDYIPSPAKQIISIDTFVTKNEPKIDKGDESDDPPLSFTMQSSEL